LWLLCTLLGCAQPDLPVAEPQPTPLAANELAPGSLQAPNDALLLCSGHITGAPPPDGSPSRRISWRAFTSRLDAAALTESYSQAIGVLPRSIEDGCAIWRHPTDEPTSILEVCPIDHPGPWSSCHEPKPDDARSVILTSTMSGSSQALPPGESLGPS
jgi:hypothetical protein